jgi:hypothetical protein
MSVDIVAVEVGTVVAFFNPWSDKPVKRKIGKVHKNGRFVLDGGDLQFTPKKNYHGPHSWSAIKYDSPTSNRCHKVFPWSDFFDQQIEQKNNMLLRKRQISAIQQKVATLHYREGAKIERLLEALGIQFDVN